MARIFAGLSGGVDSAVSAALLKEQGHDVVGAFIKIWSPEFLECTWREDRLDAMRVCVALGIPFKEVDLSREYREAVVSDMIENYQKGITPNPDVLCNRVVKFGAFAQWAFAEGAEAVATGHYAQVKRKSAMFSLLRGKDAGKDQSYFLYLLGQKDLRRAFFPVGGLPKSETRSLAKKFCLPVAKKPDSQGLCFVGDVSLSDFLGRFLRLTPGPILENGNKIGEHQGAALYTVGQRHGIDAPGGPHFVTRIDAQENAVHVSKRREDALARTAKLANVHWIEKEPVFPLRAQAQARYHATPAEVTVSKDTAGIISVECTEPQLLSQGQSLVVYDAERCLGGGVIHAAV